MKFNCSVWGQEGIFRLFLTTDLTHAAIIERSGPIKVRTNREYAMDMENYVGTVFPCPKGDIKALNVDRPRCAGQDDKVRLYGRGNKLDFKLSTFFTNQCGMRIDYHYKC